MRGFNFVFGAGLISILLWWKGTYYDEWVTKPKQAKAAIDLERIYFKLN